ncbi:MAG: polyprenyl synthetase family protein [Myxococcota bacterium]
MHPKLVLLRQTVEPPTSLRSSADLEDVERMMRSLAAGDRLERSGVMVQEHLATGGKRIRARLALCATAALGGRRRDGLGWAAAVELLHNATLIHDDIQDGDRMRRGQSTTWVRHGSAQAINAGDLLLMLPFLALDSAGSSNAVRWHMSRCLAEQATRIVRGQVEDIDMLSSESFTWDAYLRVVEGKTGGLFALPVQGAALLTGGQPELAEQLGDAFLPLGVLFQLQDDVLDLYGDKGRELPGADLREGKVSALVIAHLERCPEDQSWMVSLLRAPRDGTPQVEIEDAIARFRESGALGDVLLRIRQLAAQVEDSTLLRLYPELHAVARQLSALAIAPIRHLWA